MAITPRRSRLFAKSLTLQQFLSIDPEPSGEKPETVAGVFQKTKRVGRFTFYNEVEARGVKQLCGVFLPVLPLT
jgi:hypothetical protein